MTDHNNPTIEEIEDCADGTRQRRLKLFHAFIDAYRACWNAHATSAPVAEQGKALRRLSEAGECLKAEFVVYRELRGAWADLRDEIKAPAKVKDKAGELIDDVVADCEMQEDDCREHWERETGQVPPWATCRSEIKAETDWLVQEAARAGVPYEDLRGCDLLTLRRKLGSFLIGAMARVKASEPGNDAAKLRQGRPRKTIDCKASAAYWSNWQLGWFDDRVKLFRPSERGGSHVETRPIPKTSTCWRFLEGIWEHMTQRLEHHDLGKLWADASGKRWSGIADHKCRAANRQHVARLNKLLREAVGDASAPNALVPTGDGGYRLCIKLKLKRRSLP